MRVAVLSPWEKYDDGRSAGTLRSDQLHFQFDIHGPVQGQLVGMVAGDESGHGECRSVDAAFSARVPAPEHHRWKGDQRRRRVDQAREIRSVPFASSPHAWPAVDVARRLAEPVAGMAPDPGVIASALFEIAYIAYRASRAEPSHYNFETPFSTLMFQLMGVGATLLVLIPAGAGIVAWRRGAMADPFGRSVTLALIMSGILGLVTGAFLSTHGGHFVGTPAQGAGTWPVFGWSTAVGDLRAAHFVGLHILQFLPIAGWIIMRLCNADRAMFAVNATAVALAILTLSLAALAYAGLPVSL